MSRIVVVLLLAIACTAQADVRTFEEVEWLEEAPNMWYRFPEDSWAWKPSSLPVNLFRTPHHVNNWHRIRFHLAYVPPRSQSLYLPKLRVRDATIYVNRLPVWRMRDVLATGASLSALQIPIPPGLLRSGENTIHLETEGYAMWHHGISRVYLGDTVTLSKRAAIRDVMQKQVVLIVAVGFGAIGLLSLWLWLRVERDPVLFWYGASAVTLLAATAAWFVSLWRPELEGLRVGLLFMRYHGYLVPFFILHLRLAKRKHVWLEGALWLAMAAAFFSVSQRPPLGDWLLEPLRATAWMTWGIAFSVLPALLTVPLLMSPSLRTRPTVLMLVVADFAACLLPLHDWAWRLGFLDFDRPFLVYFAPAFVMLAAAVPITERVQSSLRAREQSRLELERRVAEKTREIEASHERLREVQREAALAEERRRIMADMHDGIGARLVALLSVAQSGKARQGEISEAIAATLDELRLTVDSVQPVEGDVSVVLGNVRHRMRSVFERSGIKLNWNVSELPRMEDLTPERILAIQRIFLEAFSNAIRHSGAHTVSVFSMRVPGAIRIVIEDDGCGFDADASHAGTGLHNLQLRAMQAGGTLQVESKAGKGTRVTLSLPLDGEAPIESLPNTGQKTENYPVIGIPADATSS